jgi:hypothetical protein
LSRTTEQVVAAIGGGLGNQMFQYAAARRSAYFKNAELLLYLGNRYRNGSYRVYGLDRFHISGRRAREAEAGGLRRISRMRRRLAKVLPRLTVPPDPELIREETLSFNPAILSLQGSVKLSGAWQCERYFADIADIIRQEFTLRDSLDPRNREVLARIESAPSAFIHVRRGDYVTHPVDSKKFGTCSSEYYEEAVAFLQEQVGPGLRFFVFSDDPAWVRETKIGGEGAEVIDWNANRPERDLALMRHCRHAIIANSTFSWWGAWLGDTGDRIVIAPRVWLQGRSDYQDIVPERWLKLG